MMHPFLGLRRIALIGTLAGTMLIGLAACGGTDPAATAVPATVAPATAAVAAPTAAATADMGMGTMAPTSGTSDTAPTAAATAATGGGATNAVEVKATLHEWALDLSQTEVAAGPVRFVVSNTGKFPHNFTIKDASGDLGHTSTFAAAAGPQTVEVTLKPGTYTVYCSLPGHADRGQKNTLTVK